MEQQAQLQSFATQPEAGRVSNADLIRLNASLRDEVAELLRRNSELMRDLQATKSGNKVERESRRAALNLMEDAVRARQAEQVENLERCKAEGQLREASRRKDEFLATLAHELRNPLAPIRSAIHILRARVAGKEEVRADLVSMLERQVDHMVRLVDDLMEVSRITDGKIVLQKEVINFESILRRAIEASNPALESARHELTLTLPSTPMVVELDSIRISQVITNLLNNAAKYTDPNGKIHLTVKVEGADLMLSVRDNGIGIPNEMLTKIFDLFTQVEHTGSRAQGGLGIGLNLARALVESHDGTIEAVSRGVGQGSEFVVRLPNVIRSAQGNSLELESNQAMQVKPLQGRILVVDDNQDAAMTLGMLLGSTGAEVEVVHDGEAALTCLRSFKPTVMLLDLGMPGMGGLEIARRTRSEECGRDVVLIAITGWGQPEDRERTKAAGFDHHLIKPVDFDDLERLLSSFASKHS